MSFNNSRCDPKKLDQKSNNWEVGTSSNSYNKTEYSTYSTSSDPGYASLIPNTEGSIHYVAYGISEKGRDNPCNGDNIYLNGKYMKSFNFTNYTKGYDAMAGNAVFAVSGAHNNEDWAKNAFNALSSAVDLSLSDKNAIQQAMTSFVRSLPLPMNGMASQCLLHITEEGAAVCNMGGAKAFKLYNGELVDISLGNPMDISFTYDKGQRSDTYILCSSGLLTCMDIPQIERLFNQYDRNSAVKEVIQRAKILSGNHDISLIAIDVERTGKSAGKSSKKPLIIAGIAAVAAIAIAVTCFAVSSNHKVEDDPIHTGKTIKDYKNEENLKKYDEKRKAIDPEVTKANTATEDAEKALTDAASLKGTKAYKTCEEANEALKTTLGNINGVLTKADEEADPTAKLKLIEGLWQANGEEASPAEQLTKDIDAVNTAVKALNTALEDSKKPKATTKPKTTTTQPKQSTPQTTKPKTTAPPKQSTPKQSAPKPSKPAQSTKPRSTTPTPAAPPKVSAPAPPSVSAGAKD